MELNQWLSAIAKRMQAASFSPNSIKRMTQELTDHYQDILDASDTKDPSEAIARLGTVDSILLSVEQQRSGSVPLFHFLILPLLQLAFGWIALVALTFIVVNQFAMIGINANQASSPMLIRLPLCLLWSGVPVWAALFVSWRAYRRTVFRDNSFAWSAIAFCTIALAVATLEGPVDLANDTMGHVFNTDMNFVWFCNPFRISQILIPVIFLLVGYRNRNACDIRYGDLCKPVRERTSTSEHSCRSCNELSILLPVRNNYRELNLHPQCFIGVYSLLDGHGAGYKWWCFEVHRKFKSVKRWIGQADRCDEQVA